MISLKTTSILTALLIAEFLLIPVASSTVPDKASQRIKSSTSSAIQGCRNPCKIVAAKKNNDRAVQEPRRQPPAYSYGDDPWSRVPFDAGYFWEWFAFQTP